MTIPQGVLLNQQYEIIRWVGGGGGGNVYEVFDHNLGKRLAIKHLLLDGLVAIKHFKREAQLLASLDHPCLPRVINQFDHDLGQFLVMDFIDGSDLAEQLNQQQGPLELQKVLNWSDELLKLLDYLHTAHDPPIIHRDIKPANIKLSTNGQLKLIDFGLAKSAMSTQVHEVLRSVIGYTQSYAPPEQIHQTGTDRRSDIFAFGATMYHLLTGKIPSDGNGKTIDARMREAAVIQAKPDPIVRPKTLNPAIPEHIDAAIMRAMALKPEQRFASAEEFRQALKQSFWDVLKAWLTKVLNLFRSPPTPRLAVNQIEQAAESNESFKQPTAEATRAARPKPTLKRTIPVLVMLLSLLCAGAWWWVKGNPTTNSNEIAGQLTQTISLGNPALTEQPTQTAEGLAAQPTITLIKPEPSLVAATATAEPVTGSTSQTSEPTQRPSTARPATARPAFQPTARPAQPTNPPPPPDSDGDGIVDPNDPCPNEAGSNNGCPAPTAVPDSDGDGIVDPNDPCPNEAGPNNGCPGATAVPDRDGDTIPDDRDDCPDVPGDPSRRGCPKPDDQPTRVPQPTKAIPTIAPQPTIAPPTAEPPTAVPQPTNIPIPTPRPTADA